MPLLGREEYWSPRPRLGASAPSQSIPRRHAVSMLGCLWDLQSSLGIAHGQFCELLPWGVKVSIIQPACFKTGEAQGFGGGACRGGRKAGWVWSSLEWDWV